MTTDPNPTTDRAQTVRTAIVWGLAGLAVGLVAGMALSATLSAPKSQQRI